MPTSQHELVGERVLRSTVVERHSTVLRSGEVSRNHVRRISRSTTEVTRLMIVTHQNESHIGQETKLFQTFLVVIRNLNRIIGYDLIS